jgi:alpha-tubulin suppressor-like RCC1 family protein
MSSTPLEVSRLSGESVVDIAAGAFHSLAMTQQGHIFSWVRNSRPSRCRLARPRSSDPLTLHGFY